MISRRSLMASSAIVAIVPLAGCQSLQNALDGSTLDRIIAAVSIEATAIATLLQNALNAMAAQGVPGLTPSVQNTAQTALAGVKSVASSLNGSTDVASVQTGVQKIATYAAAALGALALVPGLPPPIPALLAGAAILVPVMGTIVSLVLPQPVVPPSAPAVTVDQAHALAVPTS
jgi:hypothetical protein